MGRLAGVLPLALAGAVALALPAASAAAEARRGRELADSNSRWPPSAPPARRNGGADRARAVGDIEFWEPNRGLLITHGNGVTIPAGVWAYNGREWYELAEVCGATEGSIAWAGPDDFWTVSDGRPGQVSESAGSSFEQRVPLEDNTLCHFDAGAVVGSYAHPAFEADSYQAMHAAACIPPIPPATVSEECWFGGDPLPGRRPAPST